MHRMHLAEQSNRVHVIGRMVLPKLFNREPLRRHQTTNTAEYEDYTPMECSSQTQKLHGINGRSEEKYVKNSERNTIRTRWAAGGVEAAVQTEPFSCTFASL